MEKTKHTPGPWKVDYNFSHRDENYNSIIALDGFRSDSPGFSITGCINIHDAELIASAPELFDRVAALTEENAKLKSNIKTMNNVMFGEVGKLADAMNDVDRLTEDNKRLREANEKMVEVLKRVAPIIQEDFPAVENTIQNLIHSDQPKS